MDIEIIAVGGYDEVGRNMTAVRCGKEIVIFDMGLRLDQMMIHEDAELENMHSLDLIKIKAIPDDTMMNSVEGTVKAIVCSHGHLDHIGAIPKLAHRYNAPIIADALCNGTDPAADLRREEIRRQQQALRAQIRAAVHALPEPGARVCPDPALDHRYGDPGAPHPARRDRLCLRLQARPDPGHRRTPGLCPVPPDRKGRRARLIVESNYIDLSGRCPSERIARDLVRDVITSYEDDKSAIIVSTFSSHIARVKTIAECAHEIGRKPVLLGRSMEKYSVTAEQMKLVSFPQTRASLGTGGLSTGPCGG